MNPWHMHLSVKTLIVLEMGGIQAEVKQVADLDWAEASSVAKGVVL